jgi:hypothetical protein
MNKLAAIIAALFVAPVIAQTSNTGNLVDVQGWTNTVNQSSLTCWEPGGPGYCGPQPIARPDGTINYSYGMTHIYQERNIATALPYSGSGLVVSGWNFTYTAKVGNGWDDGGYDYLQSYVKLYNGAQQKETASYTHTGTHDWMTFSLAQSYNIATKRYTTDNLTTVRYGFVGQDYNGFAGPYGPEIRDVSFTLQYRRDPCADSQLSSPLCPNFSKELAKMSTPPSQPEPVVTQPVTSTETKSTETTTALALVRSNARKEEARSQTVSQDSSTTSETQQETRTSSSQQQVQQEVRTQAQARTQTQTNQTATTASVDTNTSDSKTGTEMAGPAQDRSQTTTQASMPPPQPQANRTVVTVNTEQEQTQTSVQTPLVRAADPVTSNVVQVEAVSVPLLEPPRTTEVASVSPIISYQAPTITLPNTQNTSVEPVAQVEQPRIERVEVQQQETTVAASANNLTDRTNPINDIVQNTPTMASSAPAPIAQVNTRTQDNDLAGGVSIASIATVPAGFDAYNVALRDVAFYAPKEIYRNQRVVDNARALRQMSSDRLHQDMVDQQYRR